jgi:deoxyribodipyrimidine photo-lyase
MKTSLNIFWFRRDLRLNDNAGLYHALKSDTPVLPIFIFDPEILDLLENKNDARVVFIYHAVESLQKKLGAEKCAMQVYYGKPAAVFYSLCEKYNIGKVFANEDYEPYARERDGELEKLLRLKSVSFHAFKDQVIFSRQEVVKDDGSPYTIFTPYSNRWKSILNGKPLFYLRPYPVDRYFANFCRLPVVPPPTLASMGFSATVYHFPDSSPDTGLIKKYADRRDFPGLDATSHLGIHLRFGTISIRQLVAEAEKLSPVFLNELIWREFYQMILWHFPKVGSGQAFKPAYEKIKWINNEKQFAEWCQGKTGYPLVDAGMRQLNETGFMHNRVRMVTASFLAKHLLIDWRWGEAYFAGKLLDFDLASNNGGWQWAAGCGCDAAPYFRIFNPTLQQKKFDPDGSYIKKWLPDYNGFGYPQPIVDHVFARQRAIRVYEESMRL